MGQEAYRRYHTVYYGGGGHRTESSEGRGPSYAGRFHILNSLSVKEGQRFRIFFRISYCKGSAKNSKCPLMIGNTPRKNLNYTILICSKTCQIT